MKRYLLLLTASLSLTVTQGQATFQKRYNILFKDAFGYCGQQTWDGGYVIAGEAKGGAGLTDVCLFKTDSMGSLMWARMFGGTSWDVALSILQTADGGYILTGSTSSFNNNNANEVYLIKTNSIGDTLWTKVLGGGTARSIKQTFDGGYILAGGNGLIKTDSNGNITWAKGYSGTLLYLSSIQQTADSGYIVGGSSSGFANSYDAYLMKTDASGTPLWSKNYGGSATDQGYTVDQTTDGGYIIAGQTFNVQGYSRVYIVRTDSSGDTSWTKTYGWQGHQSAQSVQQTADGGFFITGNYGKGGTVITDTSHAYLIKTDAAGDTLWTKTYGQFRGYTRFGQPTSDGGYVAMGDIMDNAYSYRDVYLVKTDSLGNSGCYEWSTPTAIDASSWPTAVTNPGTIGFTSLISAKSPATIVNNGGTETTLCFVSVNEVNRQTNIQISPNPFSTQTTLQAAAPLQNASLTTYNSVGQLVKRADNLSGQTIVFHRDNLPSGLYFVRLTEENKIIAVDKLVVTDK